ncbi:gamma-glutamyl-gamma-aminobutyrate hydrolase family protein [Hyphomicrobium sp.]|uniref:gamma-glutamyl-gamma-aminobutyrate hydrolase family protein n=1 Tax=Hyphomicrobium sp. TaxID=82 RepID=UPI0025B83D96|nr:gamma-glutamyl-gamma-aminobutyrate hydrolase family protein [Hyphomicrobium sp.]MCC7251651.1 gamma-glutamyl-gamma-aminobutyrate hydrolase family protein [Hyphomicrobium sp.]
MSRPVVIIPCDTKVIEGMTFDAVGRKYSAAVAEVADCQPLLAPLGPSMLDMGALLEIADGILLSGSLSNVHPSLYGLDEPPLNDKALDHERDSLTLPLVREALHRKLPLFAICRGFQELNVALGGTLDQAVHAVDGRHDHREPSDVPIEDRFGPAHPVKLSGTLKSWIGQDEIIVNSLHWQGIQRLAPPLTAEAHAKDGLIEAVRGPSEHPFLFGVQWHPEWQAKNNKASIEIFRRFGDAVRKLSSSGLAA